LQNTVTQATLEKPDQIKVVRQSQTGFDALELVLLAHLLDANDLETFPTRLPGASRTKPQPRRQPGRSAAPHQSVVPRGK
jgi:hypothetical protein